MSILIYILSAFFLIAIPVYIIRKIIECVRRLFDKITEKIAEKIANHVVKKLIEDSKEYNNHKKL